jgi:hypothetical protein
MGQARGTQLTAVPGRAALHTFDPRFPVKTPAGRRSSKPAPGGQPVPHHPHPVPGAEHQLRWARPPVRSPGQHLHPPLRRPPRASHGGNARTSA